MSAQFVVSATGSDESWARWIAFQLQQANVQVHVEAPGSNKVVEFDDVMRSGHRIVVVLSKAALADREITGRWSTALHADPDGRERRLIPVIVEPCDPGPLLGAITPVRLYGVDRETALARLLRVLGISHKVITPPGFPGATEQEARSLQRVDRLINEPPTARPRHLTSTNEPLARLRLLSNRAAQEVGQVAGGKKFASGLYVHRDVQDLLLRRLRTAGHQPQQVVGEPGSGKSSLLWGLATALLDDGDREVFLLKAMWLREKDVNGRPFVDRQAVQEAVHAAAVAGLGCTLLIDTVDLLVHGAMLETCGSAGEGAYLPGDRVEVSNKPTLARRLGRHAHAYRSPRPHFR